MINHRGNGVAADGFEPAGFKMVLEKRDGTKAQTAGQIPSVFEPRP